MSTSGDTDNWVYHVKTDLGLVVKLRAQVRIHLCMSLCKGEILTHSVCVCYAPTEPSLSVLHDSISQKVPTCT